MSVRSFVGKLFSGDPEVKPEPVQESVDKQQQEPSVKDSTLENLRTAVSESQKDSPKDRLSRIHDGKKRRILARTTAKLNSPDSKNKNPEFTLKEAADYIIEAGGKVEAKDDGTFSINLNTSKLPKGKGEEEEVGFMDLLPPMKEFSLTIHKEKEDGSVGEQTYSQRIKTRVVDGHMQCFYKDPETGKDVVVDTSKLDLGHVTVQTSLEFDENWTKKQAKEAIKARLTDTSKEQLDAADEQARLIAETSKLPQYTGSLPHRNREYTSYDENTYNPVTTQQFEQSAISGAAAARAMSPAEIGLTTSGEVPSERPSGALGGRAFLKSIENLRNAEWEKRVVAEILRGNIPDFMRKWVRITETVGGNTITYYTKPDYLCVGSDSDYVRVPLSPGAAQIVANKFNSLLPTPKMVDQIWKNAPIKLEPQPLPWQLTGRRPDIYLRHEDKVDAQLGDAPLGTLVAGHKKDIVCTHSSGRVNIYGWHHKNGYRIQPANSPHEDSYADYSHGVRLISREVEVNGKKMDLADVLQNPAFASVISDGALSVAQITYPTKFV